MSSGADGITVLCRIRPRNTREQDMPIVTKVLNEGKSIQILSEEGDHSFNFDAVVDTDATQEEIYNKIGLPVLNDVMAGFNGTIFAYGQTGSGKTFTMQGPETDDQRLAGIIPRITHNMFNNMMQAPECMEFLCRASLVEIYCEKIRDLFNPAKQDLKVREDKTRGIWIEGAEEFYIGSAEEALELLKMGQSHRAVTSTKMNSESSRSHSIFILTLVQKNNSDGSTKTSKLFLVDLAGSEKVRKTGAEGQTLEEAKSINVSLSALGNVINALTDGKSTHVPYRNSKLTRILQESLGGNSRTALVINVSPASDNANETTSTCRFGARAKTVKNHAKMNLERSSAELKMLLAKAEKEIERQRLIIVSLEEEIIIIRAGGKLERESAVGKASASSFSSSGEGVLEETEGGSEGEGEGEGEGDIAPLAAPSAAVSTGRLSRNRSGSIGIELEIKALEAQSAKKEEELVLLQDENDLLREQIEERKNEIDRLEEEIREHQDSTRDLEEDVKNMRVELEAAKYKFEEIAAELEDSNAQNKILRAQLETQTKAANATQDLTTQVAKLIPELQSESEAVQAEEGGASTRAVRPSPLSAAEEAEKFVMAVESGSDPTASAPTEDGDLDADESQGEEPEIGVLTVDLDAALSSTDPDHLKDLLQQSVAKMKELQANRESLLEKKIAQEKECVQLKARMKKDMTDYKKWKAAVLVDLRSRIDRNIRLEISLDETKERYESLLKNSHDPSKKRLHFLEQSVQCLTKKCQESQKQIEAFAAESKVNDTKIQRKNERIKILELLLNDARERNEKIRQELHSSRGNDPSLAPSQSEFVPPPAAPDDSEPASAVRKPAPSTLLSSSRQQNRISDKLASVNSGTHSAAAGASAGNSRVVKPIKGSGGAKGDEGTVSSFTSWFKKVVR